MTLVTYAMSERYFFFLGSGGVVRLQLKDTFFLSDGARKKIAIQ